MSTVMYAMTSICWSALGLSVGYELAMRFNMKVNRT